MANETSTVQSLKAVDAWIDVINANINGGVRTAYKSSRLKFAGNNITIGRAGNATSLPLQFPETGLITANTVIDSSQGAITTSTENTHLAIQGDGFFVLCDPASITASGAINNTASTRIFISRDGEFHVNQKGLLVNGSGYVLVTAAVRTPPTFVGPFGTINAPGALDTVNMRAVYDDGNNTTLAPALTAAVKLSDFVGQDVLTGTSASGGAYGYSLAGRASPTAILKITRGRQNLPFTALGSTVYDIGYSFYDAASGSTGTYGALPEPANLSSATIFSKSLEASNASMTQSVPELSLAQKLFSALTKVLQISQTNTDAVLNLVR